MFPWKAAIVPPSFSSRRRPTQLSSGLNFTAHESLGTMDYDNIVVPQDGSDIRARTLKCKQLFLKYSTCISDLIGSEWFDFRRADFNLWSRTMSATAQGKSSMDHRLRHHDGLRRLICNLLDGLAEALSDLFKSSMIHPQDLPTLLRVSHLSLVRVFIRAHFWPTRGYSLRLSGKLHEWN